MTTLTPGKYDYPCVELTDGEVNYAMEKGLERSYSYNHHTARGKWSLQQVQQIGALSELMMCKRYDSDFDDRIYRTGDDGSDLLIQGTRVDVKSSTYHDPDLLVKEGHTYANVFVLVWLPPEDGFPFSRGFILGCATREKVEEQEPVKYPTDIPNHVIHWRKLRELPKP